jgi:serine phosphatase RsbU (regulator of sigma subunit)
MMYPEHASRSKGNILIVDDTPANLRLLSNVLSGQGYQVRPVPEGSLAISAAQMSPPDLILLDIKMPKMNGYEVCEQLKADEKTRDIPIIFISALDAIQDKISAFAVGGVDYVTKPFQVEEVLARVHTHLTLRNLHKRLQDHSEKMERELTLAGEIQASFLPRTLPDLTGWQMSAKLIPASETSGDFFDFTLLPNGHLAFLVADVVDKGVGAALFMALCWTLIRTYAVEHPANPELVLSQVNRRIIEDTKSDLFVTLFYGVLDPRRGKLLYSNAGHCPPFAVHPEDQPAFIPLAKSGMPLGISQEETWTKRSHKLEPGAALVLYTDGITEALNSHETLFGEERLIDVISQNVGASAAALQDAILYDLVHFAQDVPLMDDVALAVLIREK